MIDVINLAAMTATPKLPRTPGKCRWWSEQHA
jgi:hypothetical protein